jgi:hypothetical protein
MKVPAYALHCNGALRRQFRGQTRNIDRVQISLRRIHYSCHVAALPKTSARAAAQSWQIMSAKCQAINDSRKAPDLNPP